MVSKNSTVANRIQEAWMLRLNQRIEECRALVASLRRETGIPVGALSADLSLSNGQDPREVLGVMLLIAALHRADSRLPACREAIGSAEKFAFAHGISTFHLPFQSALTLTLSNDWYGALELFLSAKELATDDLERGYALANIVNVQESLGLCFEFALKELRLLLRRNARLAELDGVRSQVEALDLRMSFRRGEITDALALTDRHPSIEGIVAQSVYQRLWVGALPFHQAPYPGKARDAAEFFGSSPRFLNKGYRVRTLQGVLHPDDAKSPRTTEFADRLYLWTWNWLADPSSFSIARVTALLRDADWSELASGMTAEDSQQIRNALLWLSLFDPSSAVRIEKIRSVISMPKAADYAHYRYESLVVSHLLALRDGRAEEAADYLRHVREAPATKETLLPALVAPSKDPGPLRNLRARLDVLCGRSASRSEAALKIDLSSSRIESKLSEKPVLSAPIATAFELLKRQGSAECDDFLNQVFGIPRYESEIHASKIANLLARMRQLAPDTLKLTLREGRVHAVGSWESVEIVRGTGVHLMLAPREHESLSATRLARERTEWMRELSARSEVTREDLEALTGKSRASVNRLLSELVSEGVLRREGKARNTIYKVARK